MKTSDIKVRGKAGQHRVLTHALAGLLLGSLSSGVFAEGGIGDENQSPHFATHQSKDDFEDLSVKVLGGEVKMLRRWVGDHWEWNSRWNDLVIYDTKGNPWPTKYPVVMPTMTTSGGGSSSGASFSPCRLGGELPSAEDPFYIERNGQVYVQTLNGFGCVVDDTFYNTKKRWIHSGDGFSWYDRMGNVIYYDVKGRMQFYADSNGVKVTLQRDATGNRILAVKDHHDNVVIKYVYGTTTATENRLEGLLDCARLTTCNETTNNRAVKYHYSDNTANGKLVAISDVLNPYVAGSFIPGTTTRADWADADTHKGWWMDYSGTSLTAYYDPMGRKTTISISSKGVLSSKINSDGVGATYSSSYDKEKKQYYMSVRDGLGTVTETWYHDLGGIMRKDINGETVFSSEIVLSDNGDDTKAITNKFRIRSSN